MNYDSDHLFLAGAEPDIWPDAGPAFERRDDGLPMVFGDPAGPTAILMDPGPPPIVWPDDDNGPFGYR